jgi:hypothetical protein
MSPSENELSRVDRQMLDQLVDGELPEAERRELLSKLDRIPGGWRACALGFLEAQCFRDVLGALARESGHPREFVVPLASQPRERGTWTRRIQTVLAMAAGFLIALGIGWWAGAVRQGTGPWSAAPGPATELAANEGGFAPALRAGAAVPLGPLESPGQGPAMTIALPGAGGEGAEAIRLPVVQREQLDHSLLFPDAPAFPADLREALRRAGYEVRQSRDLLPIPVQGGRHAVVPVDQVEVHYVGNHVE